MRTWNVRQGGRLSLAMAVALLLAGCGSDPGGSPSLLDVDEWVGDDVWSVTAGSSAAAEEADELETEGPIARIEASAVVGIAPLTITFSGQHSVSPSAQIADYAWDFDDGSTGDGRDVYHTYVEAGLYSAELCVTDKLGESGSAQLDIAVLPTFTIKCNPEPPTGASPLKVEFIADSISAIPDVPFSFEYHWDYGDGSVGTGKEVVHIFKEPGVYNVTLSLACALLSIDCASREVAVVATDEVARVVADAGPDQAVDEGELVTLDGSGSRSGSGHTLSYTWSQTSGPRVTLSDAEVSRPTFPAPAVDGDTDLVFELTVSDGEGSAGDSVIVTVRGDGSHEPPDPPGNQRPVADAGPDQLLVDDDWSGDEPVTLDGGESYDPDGEIVYYCWQDGVDVLAEGTSPVAKVSLSVGVHNIWLTVKDNDDAYDGDGVIVTIEEPANQSPVADAGPDQTLIDGDDDGSEAVTLDGSGSHDPDGTIVHYRWTEGEALLAEGASAMAEVVLAVGVHNITLTVTDDDDAQDSDEVVITINALPTFIISGHVTDGAGPLSDVTINGLPDNPVTNADGNYTATVNYGFSGTATPSKPDYAFSPPSRLYSNVTSDQPNQDYEGASETFEISGYVSGPQGDLEGVVIQGLPGDPTTGQDGNYSTTVVSGWSGTATPVKDGFEFTPASRDYANVTADQLDQDYTGTPSGASLVLDIPTPSPTRMSPCPVFASLDFDASNTADGSTWDQCRITWSLARVGGLDPWPAKYRYVTDPRPGTGGAQRDLATAGRGFNMAWLLTEGDWTISCTATNPSWQVSTVSSDTITIAPNTRTKKYVNSAIGVDDTNHGDSADTPYATLDYAFYRHGAAADIEYVVAGGHTEDVASPLSVNADNAYVRWDGAGNRPALCWSVDSGGYPNVVYIPGGVVHQVWQGVQLEDISGGVAGGTTWVRGFGACGNLCAIVDCLAAGSADGDRLYMFVQCGGTDPYGLLIFKCMTEATRGYSLVYDSSRTYNQHAVIGCNLGLSTNESVIRTTADVRRINVLYNWLTNDMSKSTLRLANGNYHQAYGNKLTDGDTWLGEVTTSGMVSILRFEANHLSGTTSVGGLFQIRDDLHDATICNNVLDPDSQKPMSFGNNPAAGLDRIKFLCNTALVPPGTSAGLFTGGGDGTNPHFSDNQVEGNLCIISDLDQRPDGAYFYDVSNNALSVVSNNVLPPFGLSTQDHFARVWVDGTCTYAHALIDWNALSFVGMDHEVNTAVDTAYVPSPVTSVMTPDGVYDDYYGNTREAASWAGAVAGTP